MQKKRYLSVSNQSYSAKTKKNEEVAMQVKMYRAVPSPWTVRLFPLDTIPAAFEATQV